MEQSVAQALAATGIYATLTFFLFVWIANTTGKVRRRERIALGDGGNAHLAKLMRGTANLTENVPIFLIMLALAALIGTPAFVIHIIGLAFLIGRTIHASYFVAEKAPIKRRFVGFGIALVAHALLALGLLAHGLWDLVT